MPADVPETTYFIYYSHGEKPATPCAFSLYFKVTHKFFFIFSFYRLYVIIFLPLYVMILVYANQTDIPSGSC